MSRFNILQKFFAGILALLGLSACNNPSPPSIYGPPVAFGLPEDTTETEVSADSIGQSKNDSITIGESEEQQP
ncbi:MAG: hypothetical protein K6A32_01400 [Bacteroidales bacterium]|nr:hypothetical protein [Bacteroidales bacterium]